MAVRKTDRLSVGLRLREPVYRDRNRLTEATELTGPGGSVLYDAQYTYDMFDRRSGVYEDGSQVLWTLYDGANAYADFGGGGMIDDHAEPERPGDGQAVTAMTRP